MRTLLNSVCNILLLNRCHRLKFTSNLNVRLVHIILILQHSVQLQLRVVEICLSLKAIGQYGPLVVDFSGQEFLRNLSKELFLVVRKNLHLCSTLFSIKHGLIFINYCITYLPFSTVFGNSTVLRTSWEFLVPHPLLFGCTSD